MRLILKPAPLDHARDPFMQLVRQDWIWRGVHPIDGIYVPKEHGAVSEGPASLVQHLPQADEMLETGEAMIILFDKPRILDCGSLGRALPLRRLHGALCSFPFKPPQHEHLRSAIADKLLVMRAGHLEKTDMGNFCPSAPEQWFDISNIVIEHGIAPPRRPGVPEIASLKISDQGLLTQDYADAGLQGIHDAIRNLPKKRRWRGLHLPTISSLAAIICAAIVVSDVLSTPYNLLFPLIAMVAAAAMLIVFLSMPKRRPGPDTVRQRSAKSSANNPPSPQKKSSLRTKSLAGNIASTVAVAIFVILMLMAGASIGAAGDPAVILITLLIMGLLFFVILLGIDNLAHRGAPASTDGKTTSETSQAETSAKRDGSGLLQRLFGKLLQNTPFAGLALRKFDRRVNELKRLFDEGRIEEALKKSLALGGEQQPNIARHADLPIAGPGMREHLDIQANRTEGRSVLAALPAGARQELEALYRDYVQKCIASGAVEHAAFILAELLNETEAAVKVFADAGRFATAAQLAQGRRLSPSLFIPLWYRAGEHQRALQLAERHDAYELLLKSTDENDTAFRDLICRVWCQRLAAVGDYAAALTVSETLAGQDKQIQTQRMEWMTQGLAMETVDAEIIARALKALPLEPSSSADPAMAAFEGVLQACSIEASRQRKRLAELLVIPGFEANTVTSFRQYRLPRAADQLPRMLLADHAWYGVLNSHQLLSNLADAGGQTTLAADIRRLPRCTMTNSTPTCRQLAVGPKSGAAGIVAGAPMRGNRLLLAYEDGRLQLLDARNEEIWQDQLWNPRAIIPIMPGRFAIVIRDEPGERRLSVG